MVFQHQFGGFSCQHWPKNSFMVGPFELLISTKIKKHHSTSVLSVMFPWKKHQFSRDIPWYILHFTWSLSNGADKKTLVATRLSKLSDFSSPTDTSGWQGVGADNSRTCQPIFLGQRANEPMIFTRYYPSGIRLHNDGASSFFSKIH